MKARRPHVNRVISRAREAATTDAKRKVIETPRKLGSRAIDFSCLPLPPALRQAFAEAFWAQENRLTRDTLYSYWHSVRAFARFAHEKQAICELRDVNTVLIGRYIEWLNRQVGSDGTPWHASTRASAYGGIRMLLRWLQRSRPHLLGRIDFPHRVFPGRHASLRRAPLSPQVLRAILKACEEDIAALRALRERGAREMALARGRRSGKIRTLGEVLLYIEEHHSGVAPPALASNNRGNRIWSRAFALGGYRVVEPYLYPRLESIFPYYLAILIHAAGNPQAIAELEIGCLQPIPLLDDRELLVWSKGRASRLQRRAFRTADPFGPPALVREIVQWTQRLRPRVAPAYRNRLFIAKSHNAGIHPPSWSKLKKLREHFIARHHLPPFALSAIRPSVLTAVYRVSGDLRQVKEIANHAHLSTTVGYVRGPEARSQNQLRIAAVQGAFLGHLEQRATVDRAPIENAAGPPAVAAVPPGVAVSMFGFDCKDPFAGIAPGTRAGELCTHYLGCFTCPNAVITAEPASLARLLQARDHLRSASSYLHPARWEAIYALQLRILEEDILTRFSARELAAATPFRDKLPSLPQLR
jgi:site-specific recombinase XerD